MPSPLLGLTALIVLYVFCLAVSFLVSLIYFKRPNNCDDGKEIGAPQSQDNVFYFERVRRRRRKNHKDIIAIQGKIIDENEKTPS